MFQKTTEQLGFETVLPAENFHWPSSRFNGIGYNTLPHINKAIKSKTYAKS
jgi:hypothetical protein